MQHQFLESSPAPRSALADSSSDNSLDPIADAGSVLPIPSPSIPDNPTRKPANTGSSLARPMHHVHWRDTDGMHPDSPPEAALDQRDIHAVVCVGDDPEGVPSVPAPALLGPDSYEFGIESAGYECSDDMECMSMRHCTNCKCSLWTDQCNHCGHFHEEDHLIFNPLESQAACGAPRDRLATVLAYDERMTLHSEGPESTHPERPDRVKAVMSRLVSTQLQSSCRCLPGREATRAEIESCHTSSMVDFIDSTTEHSRLAGGRTMHLKSDTYVNEYTAMCARLSAGACVDVAEAVARGEARAGAAICRPPGHHAESNTSMGFCFYNNAAIAARAAQRAGATKVLIFDWDIHHGNGTHQIFEGDASVLYMSIHRYDNASFYPGTGSMFAVGAPGAEGFSVNLGWPCGNMHNGDYMAAMHHLIMPIAHEFAPDMVVISAGYDAASGDPIGGCHLTPEAFAHMASMLQSVAPTVALLEGGYNLIATAAATEATLRVLMGERPPPLPPGRQPSATGMAAIAQAIRIQSSYWTMLGGMVGALGRIISPSLERTRTSELGLPMYRPFSAAALHMLHPWEDEGEAHDYNEEEEEDYVLNDDGDVDDVDNEDDWGPLGSPPGFQLDVDTRFGIGLAGDGLPRSDSGPPEYGPNEESGQTARLGPGNHFPFFSETKPSLPGGETESYKEDDAFRADSQQAMPPSAVKVLSAGESHKPPGKPHLGSVRSRASSSLHPVQLWKKVALKVMVMKRSGKHGVRRLEPRQQQCGGA